MTLLALCSLALASQFAVDSHEKRVENLLVLVVFACALVGHKLRWERER